MIRISHVEYINTLPYKVALEKSDFIRQNSIISKSHPAGCAYDLINGLADIGLVPVGALNILKDYKIIEGFGLASKKNVKSVLLVSNVSINLISKVFLDYQSKTSNGFVKILAEKFWNCKFDFIESGEGYIDQISGNTAGIVIGDKALENFSRFPYVYDIAQEWHKFTGLPSVYAVWVTNNKANKNYLRKFVEVLNEGVENVNSIADSYQKDFTHFNLIDYLTNNISYRIGEQENKSLELYLKLLRQI